MNLENAQIAMKIILHAGDAREKVSDALKALKSFNIKKAETLLAEASEDLIQAHQVQTDALQAESRGEEIEYSILFTHAQDTCMTVGSELDVSKRLLDICKSIDERFKKIEENR